MPPAMHRRRRHVEGDRRRSQRTTVLDRADQRETSSQSELGVSVQQHPCPPLSVSPGRPTASKEGRIEPQPFTTSVGRTASYPEQSRDLVSRRLATIRTAEERRRPTG